MFERKKPNNCYSYWQALLLSFYSSDVYVDAMKRWRGCGALYLLLLSFLIAIPMAFESIQQTRQYFSESIEPSIKNMPKLLLQHGKISIYDEQTKGIAKEQVWIWPPAPKLNQKSPDMVININRSLKSFDAAFVPVLVTHEGIRIQTMSPLGKEPISDMLKMPEDSNEILTPKKLNNITKSIKQNLLYTIYPYLSWLMFTAAFPFVGFFAFIALLLAEMLFKYKIKLPQSMRIACLAITPSIFLMDILYYFHQFNQNWAIVLMGICIFYYLFGIRACRLDVAPALGPIRA